MNKGGIQEWEDRIIKKQPLLHSKLEHDSEGKGRGI